MASFPPDPKFILKGEMGLVHCFNFSPTNSINETTYLYVGNEDGEVFVWNLITKKLYLKQKLGSSIQTIHFHDTIVIIQEKDGKIKLYKLQNDNFLQIHETITTQGTFCKSIMVDHLLFTAGEKGVEKYNINTMKKENSFILDTEKNFGMLMCLTEVVKDSGIHILALYETGNAVLWNTATSSVVDELLFQVQPLSVTFNKIRGRGIVVGASNTIQVFEVVYLGMGGTRIIYEIQIPRSPNLTVAKSRTDGLVFVIGGSDGKLRYFSWKTFNLLAVLTEHTVSISDIQFIPQKIPHCHDRAMAASSIDGAISFWEIY
ncbi:guanine nucleotide-binding protein subunit beta-like protein 1 [Harmonia axyridis]|uniref:guanine nucleotide-binding protein subunit beta-like protein 1 n=1 Tax=Harmonia axyridis TaxID=115357 RepID=UPI001E2755A2|nr:guanine nucleotide-binding protein subunit beta-like protein 1 [Harmonia axyridis]